MQPQKIIKRYFIRTEPKQKDGELPHKQEIDEYFDSHALVLLGEPGLGKTTSFQDASSREPGAEFVRIGEFLTAPSLTHLDGKTLYLDGLDEHRSRADGVDVMDALISRLKVLNTPKVRISCRTAEWHGGKDLSALSAISNGQPIVKLELQPLLDDDVLALFPGAEDFIAGARARGLGGLLENPQDLFLLHDFYSERNSWPRNRSDLFEGACKVLLREPNEAHYKAIDDWVTDRELEHTSDYLAAILLLSNIVGISSDRTTANKSFPPIHEFDGNLFAMKAATGRRVFKGSEENRIEPKHRMIAEYMAARFLAMRVREGLSLRRVMALMTGIDGGTPPDLRGVYAWLVTLLSGMAHSILVHDPYAAIIYGDPSSWTPSTKHSALSALEKHATKDPWFRGDDHSREALGGLSDEALIDDFQRLLRQDTCRSHLVSTVLDIIAGGGELPNIADDLIAFVRRTDRPGHLRSMAVDAFATAAPGRTGDLIALLDDVNTGTLADDEDYLRGALLHRLYPLVVGPNKIAQYLSKPSDTIIGWYHMFLIDRIFAVADGDLITLAESLVRHGIDLRDESGQFYYRRFVSGLVRRLMEKVGSSASAEQLLSWLSLGMAEYDRVVFEGDDAKKIRTFFESNERAYTITFLLFLKSRFSTHQSWHQIWWRFRELVAQAAPPYGFPKALIDEFDKEEDPAIAAALYELACVLVMDQEPADPSVSLETLIEIAERSPAALLPIYKRSSHCPIEEWRQKDARRKAKWAAERETRRNRNIAELSSLQADIEAGRAVGVLEYFARIWFGLFSNVDHDCSPKDRLETEVGKDLSQSIISGFKNSLDARNFNTLEEIAEASVNHKSYYRGYLMLAAMDVVAAEGEAAVTSLPDAVLSLAISYNISNAVDARPVWPAWMLPKKAELYETVLERYWRAQILVGAESLSDFYTFNSDDPRLSVIARIIPRLLSAFPKLPPRLLEEMLVNAVRYCPADEVRTLADGALKNRFKSNAGQRTMWLAAGFTASPDDFYSRLRDAIRKSNREKWPARKILFADLWKRGPKGQLTSPPHKKKLALQILGQAFDNVPHVVSSEARFISDRDEPTAAEEVRALIHSFGHDPSDAAADAIRMLLAEPTMNSWHANLLYAMANQVRTAREARFTYADVGKVVATLSDAEPANVADLKALIIDALKEIANELRHGNTDGWKSFWNVVGHGKPTGVHIDEETARNRLLELLRPKLRHLDIVAEPEVRYAEGKRSDIAIYCGGMKLPIEIKRDDHAQIWTAAEDQLKKQYSRDPASEGNGIYLAFWFDGKGMKRPPEPHKKPLHAVEFEKLLRQLVPESSAGLIDVIVMDVSVPH